MGVDRGLVRAFGFFSCGVVAIGAGGAGAIALVTGKSEIVRLFLPLLVGYGLVVLGLWGSLAVYYSVRSRMQPHT